MILDRRKWKDVLLRNRGFKRHMTKRIIDAVKKKNKMNKKIGRLKYFYIMQFLHFTYRSKDSLQRTNIFLKEKTAAIKKIDTVIILPDQVIPWKVAPQQSFPPLHLINQKYVISVKK